MSTLVPYASRLSDSHYAIVTGSTSKPSTLACKTKQVKRFISLPKTKCFHPKSPTGQT